MQGAVIRSTNSKEGTRTKWYGAITIIALYPLSRRAIGGNPTLISRGGIVGALTNPALYGRQQLPIHLSLHKTSCRSEASLQCHEMPGDHADRFTPIPIHPSKSQSLGKTSELDGSHGSQPRIVFRPGNSPEQKLRSYIAKQRLACSSSTGSPQNGYNVQQ